MVVKKCIKQPLTRLSHGCQTHYNPSQGCHMVVKHTTTLHKVVIWLSNSLQPLTRLGWLKLTCNTQPCTHTVQGCGQVVTTSTTWQLLAATLDFCMGTILILVDAGNVWARLDTQQTLN